MIDEEANHYKLAPEKLVPIKSYQNGSHFSFYPAEHSNEDVGPVIVYSTTYYETSKFYPNNTAVINFRARYNISTSQKWYCHSTNNLGEKLTSETSPRFAYLANIGCYLHTFLADCKTVNNPNQFSLTSKKSGKSVNLPIRLPVKKHLPVVSCIGSIFFAERWQPVITSIEMLSALGISKQAYYFVSGSSGIHRILQEYDKEEIIDLHYWVVPDIDEVNAKKTLYGRDQTGTYNDCFQLYREAADFIIIHDVDDILLLPERRDYYNEFSKIFLQNSQVAYLQYGSYPVNTISSSDMKSFNAKNIFQSAVVGPYRYVGKSVYDTSRTETVWVHKPHFLKDNMTLMEMPLDTGLIFHMRGWTIDGNKNVLNHTDALGNSKIRYAIPKADSMFPDIFHILPQRRLEKIITNINSRIQKLLQIPELADLRSTDHYYAQLDACLTKYTGRYAEIDGCRTPYVCQIDPVPGFHCMEAVQHFSKEFLEDNFIIFVPEAKPIVNLLHNGCKV